MPTYFEWRHTGHPQSKAGLVEASSRRHVAGNRSWPYA